MFCNSLVEFLLILARLKKPISFAALTEILECNFTFLKKVKPFAVTHNFK